MSTLKFFHVVIFHLLIINVINANTLAKSEKRGSHSDFKGKQPNFLIISVDDVSWFEHSVYGTSNVPTPNVDRIANEGIIFNNGYVSAPSCAPSRAALLSGKHFWQLEQGAFMQSFFPKKFATYPQILQENGYETCSVGKNWGPGIAPKLDGHNSGFVAGDNYNHHIREDAEKTRQMGKMNRTSTEEQGNARQRIPSRTFCARAY